ncbi:GntR family transcriptional regulator [Piscinibacter sakaiensis]|uniref:Transcriptional regulator, GntR family n=1 Tax=Piscinibacter sakaiensis TaxID=1547922 RepID=A0A0K8P5P1_PISS1|nr:GntR family transcriptional regulator [Piscinibacter sakaiensis]GAP37921.1 transcriptional regulator, GntR family [Piscinibacter sakaiensis]
MSPSQFVPVRQRRAFEEVCDQIRRAVAEGVLAPGDRLPPEREMCAQFGVSRTAIREALRSLEVAGIIHCQQGMGGGSFIRRGDSNVVAQAVRDMVLLGQISSASITEARILLCGVAIRLACERATAADLDAIERDIDESARLTTLGDLTRRNTTITEFYRLLARATHNEVIVMLLDSLSEIVRTLLVEVGPQPRDNVVAVRRRILRHLRARDTARATAAMTSHLAALNGYLETQQRALAKGATAEA